LIADYGRSRTVERIKDVPSMRHKCKVVKRLIIEDSFQDFMEVMNSSPEGGLPIEMLR